MTAPRHDWRNRIDAALDVAAAARPPVYGDPKVMVTFRTSARALIRDAARMRGVTVAGFVRRASLAMAAEVLGTPYQDAIAADPTIQLIGYSPVLDSSGRVGGPWEIDRLK